MEQDKAPMARGDPIRVTEGLLSGHEGLFDARLSDGERVRVLLRILRERSVAVELSGSHVQLISRS
jgi:transcription antitermination factor NusG